MTEQVVDEVHVADEAWQRDLRDAERRRQTVAVHLGVVLRGHHVRVPDDHCHVDGHRAAGQRGHPPLWIGHLEVRRGCSLVAPARWVVAPLVWTTADWACDDLRPPESAESCGVTWTHRESG